jgi:hypothetical protein
MEIWKGIGLVLIVLIMFFYNAKQRGNFGKDSWKDRKKEMLSFYQDPSRETYEHILKLHRENEISPQKDRVVRLWLRRVLEKYPGFNEGSLEEKAILNSTMLFSDLSVTYQSFLSRNISDADLIDAMLEAAVQYGATGLSYYREPLRQVVQSLHDGDLKQYGLKLLKLCH